MEEVYNIIWYNTRRGHKTQNNNINIISDKIIFRSVWKKVFSHYIIYSLCLYVHIRIHRHRRRRIRDDIRVENDERETTIELCRVCVCVFVRRTVSVRETEREKIHYDECVLYICVCVVRADSGWWSDKEGGEESAPVVRMISPIVSTLLPRIPPIDVVRDPGGGGGALLQSSSVLFARIIYIIILYIVSNAHWGLPTTKTMTARRAHYCSREHLSAACLGGLHKAVEGMTILKYKR